MCILQTLHTFILYYYVQLATAWLITLQVTTTLSTVQYKILEGKFFGKTIHTTNWWIIFCQMPKFAKVPKIIIMRQHLPFKWNHRVLLWHVVKIKCFTVHK